MGFFLWPNRAFFAFAVLEGILFIYDRNFLKLKVEMGLGSNNIFEFMALRWLLKTTREKGVVGWCKLMLVTYDAFVAMDFWKNKNMNVKNQY